LQRIHLIVGLLGIVAFLSTGQVLMHHVPNIHSLSAEVQMMYVSRHIYLLGAALVNVVLGLYLDLHPPGWWRTLQQIGSPLIVLSVLPLLMAFISEPPLGFAGRGWRSYAGMIALFVGVMAHLVASVRFKPN
jgi:hypothetical protein